jgi:hypothetical protein
MDVLARVCGNTPFEAAISMAQVHCCPYIPVHASVAVEARQLARVGVLRAQAYTYMHTYAYSHHNAIVM